MYGIHNIIRFSWSSLDIWLINYRSIKIQSTLHLNSKFASNFLYKYIRIKFATRWINFKYIISSCFVLKIFVQYYSNLNNLTDLLTRSQYNSTSYQIFIQWKYVIVQIQLSSFQSPFSPSIHSSKTFICNSKHGLVIN